MVHLVWGVAFANPSLDRMTCKCICDLEFVIIREIGKKIDASIKAGCMWS